MRFLVIILLVFLPVAVSAQRPLTELLPQLKTAPADTNRVKMYWELSVDYMYTQPDSALYFANQLLELSHKLHYTKGIGLYHSQLGAIYEIHGNPQLSAQNLTQAIPFYKEIGYLDGIASAYNGLGIIEGKKGNMSGAQAYFFKALKLFEQSKSKRGLIQTYIKLGVINELNNNLDVALEYYEKARTLSDDSLSDAYLTLMNNIGIVYGKKGDIKKALSYLEEGIRNSDRPRNASVHVSLLGNAGNAYEHAGDIPKALAYQRKAFEKARQYDLTEDAARALMNISYLLKDHDASGSIKSLNEALAMAKGIGYGELVADVYNALSATYKQQADYKNALAAKEEEYQLRDSIFNIRKVKEIEMMQIGYNIDEAKIKIQELELSNQRKTFERNLGLVSAIGVLAILIILFLYFRRIRKLNKQLKQSNDFKDKLFSVIAHDLQGPVSGMVQVLVMVEKGMVSEEEQKDLFRELKKQSVATMDTLTSLLYWGQAQLQGIHTDAVNVTLKSIIRHNIALLNSHAGEKHIVIHDHVPGDLEVFADRNHVDIIIRNLLSNAIKFTYESGSIEVYVAAKSREGFVVLAIKDSGTGMSPEKIKDIFTTYSEPTYGTRNERGTGMGLILCKTYLEANGGRIWVESSKGKGSTFFISLRRKKEMPLSK